jgi:TatD DNase family protein
MFIDTHSHLNFNAFKDDYKKAINNAFDADVKGIINVGSNLSTSLEATRIAHEYEGTNVHEQDKDTYGLELGIFAAVGLHPIHVKDEDFNYNKYLDLAKDTKVVAIGETGIDLYHDKSTLDIQRDVFGKLLRIANQVRKPIIMHCREGEEDLRAWLIGERNLPEGVFHCFAGDMDFANFVLDLGFLISFTGIITFTKNPKTLEVIKNIPLDKITIETDCPYLAPEPYRGKRNEPANVIEVAKKIAEIKKISLEEVENQTTKNAMKLFKLK